MKLRKQYENFARDELLDTTYRLGAMYQEYSQSSSQSTLVAVHELVDFEDVIIKVATLFVVAKLGR